MYYRLILKRLCPGSKLMMNCNVVVGLIIIEMDAEEATLFVSGEKLMSKGIPALISSVIKRLN